MKQAKQRARFGGTRTLLILAAIALVLILLAGALLWQLFSALSAEPAPRGELPEYLADPDTIVLDCRSQMEWNMGHVEGAVLLPVDELRERYAELDKSKTIVVYCGVGYRAYNACRFLMSKGYRVKNLGGGWRLINMHKGM